MTLGAFINPFEPILDLKGAGLNQGKLYIGKTGMDPETNPQACYWDAEGTIPASQPIDIVGGYPMRSGTPTRLYTDITYSVRVRNKAGEQVFYVPRAIPAPTTSDGVFLTFAAAQSAVIPMPVRSVGVTILGYYAPYDLGGPTNWQYSASLPSNPGYFQSADGAYWVLAEAIWRPEMLGARGDGSADDTTALQKTFGGSLRVELTQSYKITAEIVLRSGHAVEFSADALLRQYTQGQSAFAAADFATDILVSLNGGTIRGPGGWSSGWTGNSHPGYRGIRFAGGTNCSVQGPGYILNWGHAGVGFVGGATLRCQNVTIVGTNAYGGTIPPNGNFQMGAYVTNDVTYGAADDVIITGNDFSEVAQGVVREAQPLPVPDGSTIISDNIFHDIPGQHGIYNQEGNVTTSDNRFQNINSSCVKHQAADAMRVIRAISATGNSGNDFGGALYEIAGINGGSIVDIDVQGNGCNGGYLLTVNGAVRNLSADVEGSDLGQAVSTTGDGVVRASIRANAERMRQSGAVFASTNSTIKFWPILRASAMEGGANYGVLVNSPSITVDMYDPTVTDDANLQYYALFNIAGVVNLHGDVTFVGALDTAIRALSGAPIYGLKATAKLQGAGGAFTSQQLVVSELPVLRSETSTSGSNVVIWAMTMPDNSAYNIQATVVGMLSDGSERRSVDIGGLFYRDGGITTAQGAPYTANDIASGGFTGVVTIQANGANEADIRVNSGAAATYNWTARVTATPVPRLG